MKSIKRNPNARIFDKSNITEFELPLLTNKENSQQQYKNADLDHSTDYDYNKFFLDLLNDEKLKQIADSQDKKIFLKYISDEFQSAFPNYQDEFGDIAIQRVCTRDWCTASYALFVVVAVVAVNITVAAVDTTVPFRNVEEENVFLNGTITLATVLGNDNFASNVRSYIGTELSQVGIEL
ncbi:MULTISPECIES: hypothetical protein [Streptococcus]|jgi:hypothetical protein|uniref:Uncharacterized protein n=2 Tax=Streptococcus intermedius TaxID=1338 RepID=T1ZG48_STRIT|nr:MULTISPECIES: hypothetical protein [Streptococcus]AGU76918.1 hypothetical protein SIR_1569 [Streptococcus intermedius B196]AGU78717.1 hypothetical protein SII_1555 [Streptococcus intermedius C270]ALF28300.1 hypothetical protein RN88_07300 [Streptococcus intermedius]MDN5017284.1 hypothetical protein [Streptococcus sp. SI1]MDP1434002.1 hypothetical protein [Streptococcus intermedius]